MLWCLFSCVRERKAAPPNFLQLLTEIWAEEEYEASRKKLGASAYLGQVNAEVEARQAEIQSLKAEIRELKCMVASIVTKTTDAKKDFVKLDNIQAPPGPGRGQDAVLAALKKQLKRL